MVLLMKDRDLYNNLKTIFASPSDNRQIFTPHALVLIDYIFAPFGFILFFEFQFPIYFSTFFLFLSNFPPFPHSPSHLFPPIRRQLIFSSFPGRGMYFQHQTVEEKCNKLEIMFLEKWSKNDGKSIFMSSN